VPPEALFHDARHSENSDGLASLSPQTKSSSEAGRGLSAVVPIRAISRNLNFLRSHEYGNACFLSRPEQRCSYRTPEFDPLAASSGDKPPKKTNIGKL
jgi:hypothetical protein